MPPRQTYRQQFRYFFVHVMKTAGTTFGRHILRNFPPHMLYPTPEREPNMVRAYMDVPGLLGLSDARKEEVRVYEGHFPYAASEALGVDLVTMTLLRDPVSRTISHIRQTIRHNLYFRDKTPEETYDNALVRPWYFQNHQVKIFSLGREEIEDGILAGVTIDDRRLEIAKENLARVDVIGLTERFDEFLDTLARDYQWRIRELPRRNVSEDAVEFPPSLVERIREDNAADVAFYEHAVSLLEARRARPSDSDDA